MFSKTDFNCPALPQSGSLKVFERIHCRDVCPVSGDSMTRTTGLISTVVVLMSSVVMHPLAMATIFGSVRGIVHDPQHRPIQGAMVMLKAKSSEWSKSVTTDANGEFALNAVPIGDYSISVANPGFAQAVQNVVVISGSEPVVHFQLSLAGAKETVDVIRRARGCAHGFGDADHAGQSPGHCANPRSIPHQQLGHDYRFRSRFLRHPRPVAHSRRASDQLAGGWRPDAKHQYRLQHRTAVRSQGH